ncbi:IS481 family transposase [Variovorax paradoxus]|uniref:IS481 family transposase n=1 Tax=Variovorax paradoxus TaxID=34073 RepID=UPI003ECC1A6E
MPWQPRDLMDTKREFLELALQEGANRRELCRRFGISPKTGYALLRRHALQGMGDACTPRSTRPHHSPARSSAVIEQAVVELRRQHPRWGGRKIAQRLSDLGFSGVPAPSTITGILHRHGLITPEASQAAEHWQRFEHELPNALWQIDFKGYFETGAGRCHPLTVIDDHSRFNLTIAACSQTNTTRVQDHLQQVFLRYGLPVRINADNGAPWGSPAKAEHGLSALSVWLIRLGIRISHSAPYHPQTNGKLERFHRSLKAEVLNGRSFLDLAQAQDAFEHWRGVYNHERPHEALGMQTPAARYQVSPRALPAVLAPIEYGPDDQVLTVGWNGWVHFEGRKLRLSSALHRLPVAMRPDPKVDGCFDAFFCHHRFMRLDLRNPTTTT